MASIRIIPRHKDIYVSHTVIIDNVHYVRSLYLNRYEKSVRYKAIIWELHSPKTNNLRRITDAKKIEELEKIFIEKNKLLKQ